MAQIARRVAIMLDLQWPFKRHSEIFSGIQRYAEEHGWISILDEFVHDTLQRKRSEANRYDGIVARVNHPLARRASKLGVPLVNVWPSSPARHRMSASTAGRKNDQLRSRLWCSPSHWTRRGQRPRTLTRMWIAFQ